MVAALTDFSRLAINRVFSIFGYFVRSDNTSYIVARYLGAALQALEVLILSRLIGPVAYGEYAMWVQIAALMTIAGVGASWGFLLRHYREPSEDLVEIYCVGAVAQFAAGGVVIVCLVSLYEVRWSWALLYFAAQIVPSVIEPVMRVSGGALKYALIRAAAPLLTILLLLLGGITWLSDVWGTSHSLSAMILVGGANALSGLLFIGEYRRAMGIESGWALSGSALRRIRSAIRRFVRDVLPRGIGAGLTTIPYLINCNIDRFFLERYRPAEILGGYSLAWFLVQGGALCLHSINLLATTRIGASVSQSSPLAVIVRRQVILVSTACLAILGLLIVAALVLQNVSHQTYTDLPLLTAIVGVGHLTFGIAGVYVSASFFETKTRPTMIVLSAAGALLVAGNVIVISCGWSYIVGLTISSAILLGTNALLILSGVRAGQSRAV